MMNLERFGLVARISPEPLSADRMRCNESAGSTQTAQMPFYGSDGLFKTGNDIGSLKRDLARSRSQLREGGSKLVVGWSTNQSAVQR